mgnify:FL=1
MALETTILISVDSVITTDGMVYPLMVDNHPDMHNGVHITDCTDEWMTTLSSGDYNRVVNRGHETCMHDRPWTSECADCNIDEYSPAEVAELDYINEFEGGDLVDVEGYIV